LKKRLVLALAGIAVSVTALAGCSSMSSSGSSSSSPAAASGSSAKAAAPAATSDDLSTGKTSLGTIVVNGMGHTVYLYTADKQNSNMSTCYGQCAQLWPAVTTTSATPTVKGVTGKIGTFKRTDGTMQVTLNGWPLYTFASDSAAGDVAGQGVMKIWYALTPAGDEITKAASSGSSGSSSSSGSGSSGSGSSSSGSSAGGAWS